MQMTSNAVTSEQSGDGSPSVLDDASAPSVSPATLVMLHPAGIRFCPISFRFDVNVKVKVKVWVRAAGQTQSATVSIHHIARKLLLISRPAEGRRLNWTDKNVSRNQGCRGDRISIPIHTHISSPYRQKIPTESPYPQDPQYLQYLYPTPCIFSEPEEEPPVPPGRGGPRVAQGPDVTYGKFFF